MTRNLDEAHLCQGIVTSLQAAGGESTSCHFQFVVSGESFVLNPLAQAGIFAAMAGIVTAAYYAGREIKVVSYLQLASGVWQPSFIEPVG